MDLTKVCALLTGSSSFLYFVLKVQRVLQVQHFVAFLLLTTELATRIFVSDTKACSIISMIQILQKEAGGFSETPVLIYHTTRCYIYIYMVTATNSSSSAK